MKTVRLKCVLCDKDNPCLLVWRQCPDDETLEQYEANLFSCPEDNGSADWQIYEEAEDEE